MKIKVHVPLVDPKTRRPTGQILVLPKATWDKIMAAYDKYDNKK